MRRFLSRPASDEPLTDQVRGFCEELERNGATEDSQVRQADQAVGIMNVADINLGTQNVWTVAMFAGTVLQPAAAILSLIVAIDAWRRGAGPWLRAYAVTVSLCACILTGYLAAWGLLAFRSWAF